MSRYVHALFLILASLVWLWPDAAPAQEPAMPPPLPSSLSNRPPPELDALPPPPELQWQSLGPKAAADQTEVSLEAVAPPPETEAAIAPPPPPVIEAPAANPPDPAEMELVQPEIEVWRNSSASPQIPPRQATQLAPAYITGTEPVWLRVQFDPLAAGKQVFVKSSRGITLNLPVAMVTVSESGECLILAQLDEHVFESHIVFYCEGVKTVLPVLRSSLRKVEEKEAESGGGQ